MNPDNPSFRTPEQERRAQEYVIMASKVERYEKAIERIKKWSDANKQMPYTAADRLNCIRGILETLDRHVSQTIPADDKP